MDIQRLTDRLLTEGFMSGSSASFAQKANKDISAVQDTIEYALQNLLDFQAKAKAGDVKLKDPEAVAKLAVEFHTIKSDLFKVQTKLNELEKTAIVRFVKGTV